MRKTLYEILGVDAKASAEEIEAAYNKRIEEYNVSTISDPNKLVVLRQAKEILSDVNQRAAYDASYAAPVGTGHVRMEEPPEPSFLKMWGKWLVFGAILIAIGVWWTRQSPSPPAPEPVSPQVASGTAEPGSDQPEEEPTEEEPAPVAAARPQEAAPAPQTNVAAPQAIPPAPQPAPVPQAVVPAPQTPPPAPQAAAPPNPIAGSWSCFDPVSGRSGHYGFDPDGTLTIDWADGQAFSQRYQVSGKVVRLPDSQPPGALTIEQLGGDRMILNTGQGRRLVCTR